LATAGGTQLYYIETLLIWLHLIFIYLLQINKNIISDLQQNHVLAVQFMPPRIAGREKIKCTSLISLLHAIVITVWN